MEKSSRTYWSIFMALGFVVVGFGLGVMFGQSYRALPARALPEVLRNLRSSSAQPDADTINRVWTAIHEQYVDHEVDDEKLLEGALAGMVAALGDPYSSFFTPQESKALEDEIEGSFDGVGMEVGFKNKVLTVITPLPETPAERAGLKAGDILLSIDGTSVDSMTLEEAILSIRGKKGTSVTLVIRRPGEGDVRTFTVVRETIKVESVTSKIIDHQGKKFGYIRISAFNSDTNQIFQQTARNMVSTSVDGLILDLRNNPGGYLDQSVDIASAFVPSGVIVSTKRRDNKTTELRANGNAYLNDLTTVVLVNQGSASAAEIVAGALQDAKRVTVVGTRTFGKGSVQELQNLNDGSSLKLTIAKWYTPSGRSISDHGIEPDVVVERPEENTDADPQLERAKELLTLAT